MKSERFVDQRLLPRLSLLSLLTLLFAATFAACGSDPDPTAALRSQILAEIHADVRIAPYEVQVDVERVDPGHVVLSGSVDRPQVRELAEQIAADVSGVDTVDNRIEVRGPRGTSSDT